jgi:hypothetical protein
MSGEARHFKARVPLALDERPVDVILTITYDGLRAKPRTKKGRVFLSRYYITPANYTDQAIEIDPGRFMQTFKAALREARVRAQYDGTGNHREVE